MLRHLDSGDQQLRKDCIVLFALRVRTRNLEGTVPEWSIGMGAIYSCRCLMYHHPFIEWEHHTFVYSTVQNIFSLLSRRDYFICILKPAGVRCALGNEQSFLKGITSWLCIGYPGPSNLLLAACGTRLPQIEVVLRYTTMVRIKALITV